MGSRWDGCAFPTHGGLQPIMEPDAQGDACPVAGAACQDAEPAEHMPMDEPRLCRIFRFLEQLLDPRHAPPFLGLLHPIAYKDMEAPFFVKRGMQPDSGEPASAYAIQ